MIRSRRSKWMSGIRAVVLTGGLGLATYGAGVTPAGAQVPPSTDLTSGWDSALPAERRFVILMAFNGDAVLDRNTGLVWERAPDPTRRVWAHGDGALFYCLNKVVGGTKGWRLPSVAELASLIDPALPAPYVPASAFTIDHITGYWSATTATFAAPDYAWFVEFSNGEVTVGLKDWDLPCWCVRGGMNADQY